MALSMKSGILFIRELGLGDDFANRPYASTHWSLPFFSVAGPHSAHNCADCSTQPNPTQPNPIRSDQIRHGKRPTGPDRRTVTCCSAARFPVQILPLHPQVLWRGRRLQTLLPQLSGAAPRPVDTALGACHS